MANRFQRAIQAAVKAAQKTVNAIAGTDFGEQRKEPPAPAPTPRPAERRIEIPVQQAPRRQAPVIVPQQKTRLLQLRGIRPADAEHPVDRPGRTLDIRMTEQEYQRYLQYVASGQPEKARVYALAKVYEVWQLAGATWHEDFYYDELPFDEWPDADDSYVFQEA